MRDLAAQVTSGLLRFPTATVDALAEDEVTLDSELRGRFSTGRGVLAWLACGPNLEVVHASSGERVSAYRFSSVTDHTRPSVTVAKEFGWLKRSGLLVGLQEDESSMLCLYDLGISRVVKAVVIPNRITAIEPLASYGGASAHTQHLHQSLRWFFGVVAVVTDLGHVLLVDLCLDDLSCTQTELEASDLEVLNKSPGDIPRLREGTTRQGRHLCLQLRGPTGTGASALQFIGRTNQLAVGFTDGVLQLWNMKTLKQEYQSQLEGGPVPVYTFTFQEPENDPRNCCYLWAVQSAQDLEGDVVSLHLLQLAFGERKCLASGKILYEGLEYCEERYSQDLNGATVPLRAQASNTRLLSCQTIEKFRHHPDREDSVNEVASPDTSVAVFSWQVKSYGQGHPSTYVSVFDVNRWYHAQMPDSLRTGESMRSCPYLAVWSMDSVLEVTQSCPLLDVVVHERSLSRALPHTCPPPEQFYNPNTYNFDASCLLSAGVVHFTCCGYQKETLTYLMKSLPSLADGISNGYSRCLMSGLLSSRLADVQPSSLSEQEQLDAILTMAVETSALGLVTSCIKEWSTEERAGSTGNLRYILEWAWDKVVKTKEELDSICAPLFDCSSNFTDPQTLQLLQRSLRILTNLSTVFHCLLNQAQELTQKGVMGLMNKCMVSSLISQYAQVVLWFCRTGLLPESSDDDVLQISRPFYSFSVIKNYYTGQREELQRLAKDKWNADCLMIDGLVSQCGERLSDLWRRDQGGTGQYPPPSLHALLDLYLLENVEESAKHAIVIYLLLDVMYSFPNKSGASVESFPTAFSIPIGLVKLVQGLWLLDHHDHENALDLLLHPSVSQCVWAWQHSRVLQTLMIQNKQGTALRYLHMTRPSLSSTPQIKLCISVLLHNRCTVEAWALLRQHVNKLSKDELLQFFYETCQELGLMKDLLKLPLTPSEQECLERFLQGSGGYQNRELLMVHYLQQANYIPALQINQTLNMNLAGDRDPKMKERSNTRNSIMNQYGKVLPRAQRKLAMERSKPYERPPTIHREVTRPQPLSAMAKRPNESVLSRAAFIKNVLTKIEEVWVLRDTTSESSPLRSPKAPAAVESSPSPPTAALPQAFVGTPINMLTKRMSRLLDLAVHPSPSHASPERSRVQTTPTKPLSSWTPPKHVSKAPELSLLQTPQVVKRARALAASGPVFSSFTPQSILRTSLRPTPIATPTGSPTRSASPPLRSKESRITFLEESDTVQRSSVRWSNGLAVEGARKLKRPSSPPEGGVEAWSEHSAEEDENDKDYKDQDEAEAEPSRLVLPPLERRPSLGHETSKLSIQSDSTLEFHDALSPAAISGRMNDTNEIVIVGTTDPAEPHPGAPPDQLEESNSKIIESNQDDSVNQEKDSEPEPIRTLTTPEEPIADPNEPINGTPPKESQSHAEEEEAREEAEPIRELPAPEVSETEAMETSDLDDYVERHLFGADLSPPYDHSAEAVDEADKPVTSSEAATSDSHSVVTLHDSDELSSTKSEQQEEEEEDEEDSGSEVEIIQEVKGDSPQQQHLYLQDLPPEHEDEEEEEEEDEDRFLEDQTAAAVLSLVSDPQLKMMDGCEEEEEGEVVMVGLEPATLGTDEAEVCYTELKPSTTLLVPIELSADHQELLPDLGLPPGSNDFSLVLEADDEETPPAETVAHGDEENEKWAPDSTDGAVTEPDNGARVEEMVQSEQPVEDQPEGTTEDQPEDQREDEVEPVTESEPQEKDQPEKESQTEEEPLEEPEGVHFDKIQDSGVLEEVQSERNEVVDRTDLPEVAAEAIPLGPDLISDSTHHEESLKPVEPQQSPGRRGRRTVTFLKSATESEKDVSDEQSKVPSTPRRITRSSALFPDSHVPVTRRRSARKAEPEPEEATVPRASPGRKTPTRGTRKTRSTSANSSDEEVQTTQSVPDRIPEDKGAETRDNTKASPSRVTRQSSRSVSLVLQSFQEFSEELSVRTVTPPRSRRKTRGALEATDEAQLQNVSRRLTRSQHWHDDEDTLQKTEALEEPNPLESALLERLNDAKESAAVTEIVRAKRSTTRSALESAPTEEPKEEPAKEKEANTEIVHARRRTTRSVAPPVAEDAEQKEKKKSVQSVRRTRASKVPESSSPPSESTSTSTSVHQSTRGRKKEVMVPDVLSPPVTRTRQAASVLEDEVQSDDIGVEAEAKPRKTRASRARAAPAPVEINFLSPLPSPAERPRKKAEERGTTAPKLSLRRKRVMEAVFPKPVTRRKKL